MSCQCVEIRKGSGISEQNLMCHSFCHAKEETARVGMQAHIAKPLDIETMLKTLSWVLSAADQ